jgi:hypothetical protein
MVQASRDPAGHGPGHLFSARRGRADDPRSRHRSSCIALLWETLFRGPIAAASRGGPRAERARGGAAYDPGRERRAEQRARQLLKSCVNEEEWAMYRDLGFVRVWGGQADGPRAARPARAPYAYLVYPHKPIVAYLPADRPAAERVLRRVPGRDAPVRLAALPDSDDVLAKWMALTGDERRIIAEANLHLPGRQVDPRQIAARPVAPRRWERERPPARCAPHAASARPSPPTAMCGPSWTARRSTPSTSPAAHRRAAARGRALLPARHRLRRRGAAQADHRRRATAGSRTMPCNFTHRALAAKVKEGIREAGGTPMEVNTGRDLRRP